MKGKETFDKYYGLLEEHDLYYITTILDPRVKTKWIEENTENPTKVIDRIKSFLKSSYPLLDTVHLFLIILVLTSSNLSNTSL